MCQTYITNHSELTSLEQEALAAKFRKPSKYLHRSLFHQGDKTMTIAAPYNAPWPKTKQAIQGMINRYSPARIEVVSMPMGAV